MMSTNERMGRDRGSQKMVAEVLRTIVNTVLTNPIYEGRTIREVKARGRWFLLVYVVDRSRLVYTASLYIETKGGTKEIWVP